MNRILILDNDLQNAQTLGKSVKGVSNVERTEINIALSVEDAVSSVRESIQLKQPFTLFLINQVISHGKDGNEAMKELLALSPNTYAVIFNGFDNTNDRIRAYEAGAKRYLLRMSKSREIIIVLDDLVQMQKKKRELEYKSVIAAQTSWAAELAHEINQEVYKIQSAAYLIKNVVKNPEIYSNAEIILNSAQNLANVGQCSNQTPTTFEVDKDIKTYVTGICKKKGIILKLSLQVTELQIVANRIGFHYVFKQLIENAFFAMKDQESKRVYIDTQSIDNEKVEIRLRDSGPGIDGALRLSIFQSPITTKDRGGYGLLLVRQLIEDMRGEIILEPFNENHGAEFVIRMPCVFADRSISRT